MTWEIPTECQEYVFNDFTGIYESVVDWECAIFAFQEQVLNSNITAVQTGLNSGFSATNNNINNLDFKIQNSINQLSNNIDNDLFQAKNEIVGRIQSEANIQLFNQQQIINQVQNGITTNLQALNTSQDAQTRNILDQITDTIAQETGLLGQILNTATGVLQGDINSLEDVIQNVEDTITSGLEQIIGDVEDFIQRLWEIFSNAVRQLAEQGWNVATGIFDRIRDGLEDRVEELKVVYDLVAEGEYTTWDDFSRALRNLHVDVNQLGGWLGILQLLPMLYTLSRLQVQPFLEQLQHLGNERARPELMSPPEIMQLMNRNALTREDAHNELAKIGFSDDRISKLTQLRFPLLDLETLRILSLRNIITSEQTEFLIQLYGYTEQQTEYIRNTWFPIPPIQDLITMAVREVFTPTTAQRFGLFEDFPEEFAQYAEQQGLTREWSERYWAAHWQLPSPFQGFQMFQRRIINREDLVTLLKAQDFMPYFRERMIDLSYNPLTRVDVRRMHALNVLTRDQVYEAYLDVGYSPENAERMTEFTVRYNSNSDEDEINEFRTLTRSLIERSYLADIITYEEAIERLIAINYTRQDAELILDLRQTEVSLNLVPERYQGLANSIANEVIKDYKNRTLSREDATEHLQDLSWSQVDIEAALTLADLEYNEQVRSEIVEVVRTMYIQREIDNNTTLGLLANYNFTQPEIERLVEDWRLFRDLRTRKLTPTQYIKSATLGIIDVDFCREMLYGLGFTDISVELLLLQNGLV